MLNIGRWLGQAYENKTAIAIGVLKQDEISSQLRCPIEKKPSGYKNINSSAIRFLPNTNLTAK
jgi:hypothetical protein